MFLLNDDNHVLIMQAHKDSIRIYLHTNNYNSVLEVDSYINSGIYILMFRTSQKA